MNVSCPDCRSIFRVDPAKVPPSGVRARCSVCSGVITIPAPSGVATPPGGTARPMTSGAEAPPPERPRPSQAQTWESQPTAATQRATSPAAAAPPPRPVAPPQPPVRTEVPASPRPRPEPVERPAPTATATPPSPAAVRPPFSQPTPPAVPPVVRPTPAAGAGGSDAGPSAPPFVPSSPAPRPAAPPRPTTPPSVPQSGGDSGARRPLNPFLSKDPDQRAKRLARALVSDIITYHPAKHAEGLRDGTLKQLFREEIKKSFEEYIAQVGQQLAESTTYFQEALNEVLGGGKKIF